VQAIFFTAVNLCFWKLERVLGIVTFTMLAIFSHSHRGMFLSTGEFWGLSESDVSCKCICHVFVFVDYNDLLNFLFDHHHDCQYFTVPHLFLQKGLESCRILISVLKILEFCFLDMDFRPWQQYPTRSPIFSHFYHIL
jgi:hypothetical protein